MQSKVLTGKSVLSNDPRVMLVMLLRIISHCIVLWGCKCKMIFEIVIQLVTVESLPLVEKVLTRASRTNVLGTLKNIQEKKSLKFTLKCVHPSLRVPESFPRKLQILLVPHAVSTYRKGQSFQKLIWKASCNKKSAWLCHFFTYENRQFCSNLRT